VVLLDDQFDPWSLSRTMEISYCRKIKSKSYVRVDIVSSIDRACLDNWGRVQVVGTHTVDNEPRLLGKLVELGRVELDNQNIYFPKSISIKARRYLEMRPWIKYLGQCGLD